MSPFVTGRIQDYHIRFNIRYPKIKDVVELLDILIIPGSDNGTSIPKIFEGGVLIKNVSDIVDSYLKSLINCYYLILDSTMITIFYCLSLSDLTFFFDRLSDLTIDR